MWYHAGMLVAIELGVGYGVARVGLEDSTVDLTFWLPGVLLLGLAFLGAMFAFVEACDRV